MLLKLLEKVVTAERFNIVKEHVRRFSWHRYLFIIVFTINYTSVPGTEVLIFLDRMKGTDMVMATQGRVSGQQLDILSRGFSRGRIRPVSRCSLKLCRV